MEGEDTIPMQNGDALSTTGNKGVEEEGKPVVEFNAVGVVRELNALQTLLENRYLNKVCMKRSTFGWGGGEVNGMGLRDGEILKNFFSMGG